MYCKVEWLVKQLTTTDAHSRPGTPKARYCMCTFTLCIHVDLFHYILRTDTRIFYENKAGYTATPVACGWAGAVFEVT